MKKFATLIGAVGYLEDVHAVNIACVLIVIPRGGKLKTHRVTLRQLDCHEWSVIDSQVTK